MHQPGVVVVWALGFVLSLGSAAYVATRRRPYAVAGSLCFAAFCAVGAYITASRDPRLGPIAIGLLLVVGAAALWYLDGLRRIRVWLDGGGGKR